MKPLEGKVILLDKGHQGTGHGQDPGAVDPKDNDKIHTVEAVLINTIGNIVADDLRAAGAKVIETREGNNLVPWAQRERIIIGSKANVCLCLHLNSAANIAAVGAETFAHPSGKSARLAAVIQTNLIKTTGARDRGVKANDFFMLRVPERNGMKSVLIEPGFISNPGEERKLNDPAYQRRISAGIKAGMIEARNKGLF